MSDSLDLFQPDGFIPNELRPPNVTFKPRKAGRIIKKAVAVYQSANIRFATGSVENVSGNKTLGLSNNFNPSHCLSMRLDDGIGSSRVSSRFNDGLPTDKKSFHSLKGRFEVRRERD